MLSPARPNGPMFAPPGTVAGVARRERGWRLSALRAYDAYPMTQHVECVGLLLPS